MKRALKGLAVAAVSAFWLQAAGESGLSAAMPAQTWPLRVCADPADLPFTGRTQPGFDNEIMARLAQAMHAELTYEWVAQGDRLLDELRHGLCDVAIGLPDGYGDLEATVPYYQSPYVFIVRADMPNPPQSFDDLTAQTIWRIAVEMPSSPPDLALESLGLRSRTLIVAPSHNGEPDGEIAAVVARGEADVGIAWGPVGAYFADREGVPLKVIPVSPEFVPPSIVLSTPMVIGVRPGDTALRDELNEALAQSWSDIQAILARWQIPLDPLPEPVVGDVTS